MADVFKLPVRLVAVDKRGFDAVDIFGCDIPYYSINDAEDHRLTVRGDRESIALCVDALNAIERLTAENHTVRAALHRVEHEEHEAEGALHEVLQAGGGFHSPSAAAQLAAIAAVLDEARIETHAQLECHICGTRTAQHTDTCSAIGLPFDANMGPDFKGGVALFQVQRVERLAADRDYRWREVRELCAERQALSQVLTDAGFPDNDGTAVTLGLRTRVERLVKERDQEREGHRSWKSTAIDRAKTRDEYYNEMLDRKDERNSARIESDQLRARLDEQVARCARLEAALRAVAGDGANTHRGWGVYHDNIWVLTDAQKEIARAALAAQPAAKGE